MGALDSIPARYITVAACSLATFTILTCYSIAVYLGHVPAWLPMISDCAVQPPEKYIFRMGMITSANLLELNVVVMYLYMNFGQSFSVDKIGLILASVASFGLMMVGAINEQEDNAVHSGAAVVFFFGFEAYMIITLIRMKQGRYQFTLSQTSFLFKTLCTVYCGIALVFFVYFSSNWGKWGIEIAICEWTGTMAILGYNFSYIAEFGSDVFLGALFDQAKNGYVKSPPVLSDV
eukprot:TRINITY_DN2461_c0_g1_i1.p1 TRINITY_DN2461_c0_g1~~TRINITY_DN2461_c0_g1_i1.p1  ORF type:complete len:234 (+),score=50.03 TRINITY_DN2461_c0_g1_i1:158-859(+)